MISAVRIAESTTFFFWGDGMKTCVDIKFCPFHKRSFPVTLSFHIHLNPQSDLVHSDGFQNTADPNRAANAANESFTECTTLNRIGRETNTVSSHSRDSWGRELSGGV